MTGDNGYKWQPGDNTGVYPVNPPELRDGDILLFDEPGRCGNRTDSHCHHYRLVQNCGFFYLLVRHGAGDECHDLGFFGIVPQALLKLSSDDRFWLFGSIHHAIRTASRDARELTESIWRKAAAEKRIKTRKVRGQNACIVSIERTVKV